MPPRTEELRALAEQVEADTLSALLPQAGLALIVVTGLAAVLSWLVAGRVLRPIRATSTTARRLSAENLTDRVPVTTPANELSALAGTINGMLDRVQRGVAAPSSTCSASWMGCCCWRAARPGSARGNPDLAAIVAAALDAAEARAATADIAVRTELRSAPVSGEPVLLERMIGNLVDNALRRPPHQNQI
ncbi:HAMP domain-containing protein [Nonomuraea cavernae]|uniref:histidine kinase n=1 Tax=Nonomuraea cavernae TaxID=2045107 RepID=A0A917YR75_9ACTN|nr:HAMP domain-containing protein [Nonomuraea cavernae]MCA2184075.1 HAMP domain-containing protein [Nonomuraea cavernae]GGO62241.1 hypothetical protein GCM10012289_06430 [Nonomuraea cavernae]